MPDTNAKCQMPNGKWLRQGFSLIELLIVITIFGFVTAGITVSYLSFEQNQRLANAAKALKSDIRYIQNQALAGDKSTPNCPVASGNITKTQLIGWYIKLDPTTTPPNYTINNDCVLTFSISNPSLTNYGSCFSTVMADNSSYECQYSVKTVTFPTNITLTAISCGGYCSTVPTFVLFMPASSKVYGQSASSGSLQLATYAGGVFGASIPPIVAPNYLQIILNLTTNSTTTYGVNVYASGEVNESHN